MSRSGYSDDCENLGLWRASVANAMRGARGQHFLRKLRDALDAMPVKRLIVDSIANEQGEVCALGAVDPHAKVDPEDRHAVGQHFGIAPAMAAEIVYMNDEYDWGTAFETPESRWVRMRAWVEQQIVPDESDLVGPKVPA
jgi:hypothetical protein